MGFFEISVKKLLHEGGWSLANLHTDYELTIENNICYTDCTSFMHDPIQILT